MTLDWAQPWLAPWRKRGERVEARVAQGMPLHEALDAQEGAPVRFAPHTDLPAGTAYEDHIFRTRRVPVREGLHDFFNGLVWLEMPATKRRLNELQAAEIAARGVGAVRGPVPIQRLFRQATTSSISACSSAGEPKTRKFSLVRTGGFSDILVPLFVHGKAVAGVAEARGDFNRRSWASP